MRAIRLMALGLAMAHFSCADPVGRGGSSVQDDPPVTGRKIVPHPDGGVYLGQWELMIGDTAAFEETTGRKTALWAFVETLTDFCLPNEDGQPVFWAQGAQIGWDNGRVPYTYAIVADPNPLFQEAGEVPRGFTVDKLLNGDFDNHLHVLAQQYKEFGKPMFFNTTREPNVASADYMGGFGPNGDKGIEWALDVQKGLAEFNPSSFPNVHLYADLGDPTVSDGAERLVAAQRYYHDFFVRREGIDFLSFDTMEFGAHVSLDDWMEWFGVTPTDPNYELLRTSFSFEFLYAGDEYVDWVSLSYYIDIDKESQDATLRHYLDNLAWTMESIRRVAPGKPVLIMEGGFPDGVNPDSEWAAKKVEAGMNEIINKYPEISAFALWGSGGEMDTLLRPGTKQGDAFKKIIDDNPDSFRSCVHFSDGTKMPTCR
ncbi:hypothetical protein ACFL6C_07195 [Myxococcota bacterium]